MNIQDHYSSEGASYWAAVSVGMFAMVVCAAILVWACITGLLAERRAKEALEAEKAKASPRPLPRLVKSE